MDERGVEKDKKKKWVEEDMEGVERVVREGVKEEVKKEVKEEAKEGVEEGVDGRQLTDPSGPECISKIISKGDL